MSAQCSKVGGNLNQLARHFNSGGKDTEQLRAQILEELSALTNFRLKAEETVGELYGNHIEDEYGNTPAQRAELDWLLYNKPLEYAQMVLRGEMEHYLSLGCDHSRLED